MIFDKEFIFYEDHFVHHITTIDNIDSIKQNGLIPICGDRSKKVGDTRKAIYFFNSLHMLNEWIEALYKEKNIAELEILKFNLKRRKWYSQNTEIGDFYLTRPVSSEGIKYLRIIDENGKVSSLKQDINFNNNMVWFPIKQYKKI